MNNFMNTHSQNNGLRIAVLHKSLTPYRIPLFQALSKSERHHFEFLFSSANFDGHPWEFEKGLGFSYRILPSREIRTKNGTLYLLKDMRMITQNYDLVVLGDHLNIPELSLYLYARFKKIPVVRWIPETKNSLQGMSGIKIKLKALINRLSDGIMVPGNEGKEYVFETTHREDNLYFLHNVVNNEFFNKARVIPEGTIEELKRKFGLKGLVISFFGQLIERKGLDVLLRAIDLVKTKQEFSLLFVGDGPLKGEVLSKKNNNGRYCLYLAGYINPDDLPFYYALSDVIVLPSYIDTWGMVVNEAMAAGVPVICSTGAGAARDLIKHGKSGLVFKKGDVQELAASIELMLSSEQLRRDMVTEADKILENYTIEKAKNQFLEAIEKTYEHTRRTKK